MNFDLDTPLFQFTPDPGSESFLLRDAVQGVQCFGGIGSGKSTGSGRFLAIKYLKAGMGGLVLCVKADEVDSWREYCAITGRTNEMIVIEPGCPHHFNFLEFESSGHASISYTHNIFIVLKTVINASKERTSGKSDDAFWENALDLFILNVIDLCMLANGKVTLSMIYEIMQTAPRKRDGFSNAKTANESGQETAYQIAFNTAGNKIRKRIKEWETISGCDRSKMTKDQYEEHLDNQIADYRTLKMTTMFFTESLFTMPEKTRSIIDFSLSGFLFQLLRDPVYSLFCRYPCNYTPNDSLDGKIIILNLPLKIFHKVGQISQLLFKYVWQRAMERRNVKENGRPVFLWADEAQNFLHEYDSEYQATARSSRIATVYITQNLPNFYGNMGGDKAEFKVRSFLGTLACKFFHSNADIETNEYASSLIGEAYFEDHSRSVQMSGDFSVSKSTSYKLERIVRPEEFAGLKCGGPRNNLQVHAYIHMQGKQLQNNQNHQLISFNQNSI